MTATQPNPATTHTTHVHPPTQEPTISQRHLPATGVRRQGPWALWWLVGITLGIYYFVWYHRVNAELAARLDQPQGALGSWWSQLIPIFGIVGLSKTARRVNAAHTAIGSQTRIGPFTTWFWAPIWFCSHTRYVQRRMNLLHDLDSTTRS